MEVASQAKLKAATTTVATEAEANTRLEEGGKKEDD